MATPEQQKGLAAFELIEARKRKMRLYDFLYTVQQNLLLTTLYYPGCNMDTILDELQGIRVTYLDRNRTRSGEMFVADFEDPPFLEPCFDAIYVSDLHLQDSSVREAVHTEKLGKLLKPVRSGGLIIAPRFGGCGIWEREIPFVRNSAFVSKFKLLSAPAEFEVMIRR